MRIISYNVNGIRAAMKKGFCDWLATDPADVICVQETKASKENVDCSAFEEMGYDDYWFSAKKKGYSGVAIFTKIKPDNVQYGTGHSVSDDEGRVIQLDFGKTRIISVYFPSGISGEERLNFKYEWMKEFYSYLQQLQKRHLYIIVCGDYNIAHKEIDVHSPQRNKKTTGFLPQERAWLDRLFNNGWIDVFRNFHPEPQRYTWWNPYFSSTREQNKGWRIDYINATETLKPYLKDAEIYPQVMHSDHCPVYVEIAIESINS
jgi:exodeoxyribonuclease-3